MRPRGREAKSPIRPLQSFGPPRSSVCSGSFLTVQGPHLAHRTKRAATRQRPAPQRITAYTGSQGNLRSTQETRSCTR
jgi:hypothetical protein